MNFTELEALVVRQQAQIYALKAALAACIDVCASQNKQLGLLGNNADLDKLDGHYWDNYSEQTQENGILADDMLAMCTK